MFSNVDSREEILLIITILSISFIGCLCKSYYVLLAKHQHVKFGIIALSTITSTFVMYSLYDYISLYVSFHTFIGIIFFSGVLGKELFNQLTNMTFYKIVFAIRLLLTPNPQDLKILIEKDKKDKEDNK